MSTHPYYKAYDQRQHEDEVNDYRSQLVGQPLPCGCMIQLGYPAQVCDDQCHTAWNIAYRWELLSVLQTDNSMLDYLGTNDPKLVVALKRGSRRGTGRRH